MLESIERADGLLRSSGEDIVRIFEVGGTLDELKSVLLKYITLNNLMIEMIKRDIITLAEMTEMRMN